VDGTLYGLLASCPLLVRMKITWCMLMLRAMDKFWRVSASGDVGPRLILPQELLRSKGGAHGSEQGHA
jgi:hypothetical protein